MTTILDSREARTYRELAAAFCALVENRDRHPTPEWLQTVHLLLPRLYAAALALPRVEPDTESARERTVTHDAWQALFTDLRDRLGRWHAYFNVSDPYDEANHEPVRMQPSVPSRGLAAQSAWRAAVASPLTFSVGSSIHSSPPSRWAKGRGSVSPSATRSSRSTAARSPRRASRAPAPRSSCASRSRGGPNDDGARSRSHRGRRASRPRLARGAARHGLPRAPGGTARGGPARPRDRACGGDHQRPAHAGNARHRAAGPQSRDRARHRADPAHRLHRRRSPDGVDQRGEHL